MHVAKNKLDLVLAVFEGNYKSWVQVELPKYELSSNFSAINNPSVPTWGQSLCMIRMRMCEKVNQARITIIRALLETVHQNRKARYETHALASGEQT